MDATIALAARLTCKGTYVLFVSSNQVFDGSVPQIDRESPYCPVSAYGRQKAAAEAAILALGSNAAIVRVSKVLAPTQPMLLDWLANLLAGATIRPYFDFTLAPISVGYVTSLIQALAEHKQPGIFQISGAHDVSYVELATIIAERAGVGRNLVRPRPAVAAISGFDSMPRYSSMDMARERSLLGFAAPHSWVVIDDVVAALVDSRAPRRVA